MSRTDERLEKVEQITINWVIYKKTLKRNYLSDDYYRKRQNRNFVLRLHPSFEAEMEAEYYESMNGRHYDSNWNPKPFHINPEMILLEGTEKGTQPFRWMAWPTESNTRANLSEGEIREIGGIQEAVKEGREIFWNELKSFLPDTYNLSKSNMGMRDYTVDINWTNLD